MIRRWAGRLLAVAALALAVSCAHLPAPRHRMVGFLAMRGKRSLPGEHQQQLQMNGADRGPQNLERADNLQRATRAQTGFSALRGRRAPEGFFALRGKKAPSGFSGLRGKKAPNGFSGLRGKKAPNGFAGLRGKKASNESSGPRVEDPMMYQDIYSLNPFPDYIQDQFSKRFNSWIAKLRARIIKKSSLGYGKYFSPDGNPAEEIFTPENINQ